MNGSLYLTLATFAYIIILSILYFNKEKFSTTENKIYARLLIVTLVSLVSEIMLVILYTNGQLVTEITMRIFLFCCLIWISLLFMYLVMTFYSEKLSKYFKFGIYVIYAIAIIGIFFLPIEYVYDDNGILMYSMGSCVNLIFGLGGLFIALMCILTFSNFNIVKQKKYKPILLFILLLAIATIIQKLNPSYLLINFVFGLTIMLMYHTIENPDVKLVNQLTLAKNEAERASRAKSDFLSSVSHKIRTPLSAIVGLSENIASYKDQVPKEVIEDTEDIQNASQTLLEIVGNILDINKIESEKMEIVEIPYNFKEEITKMAIAIATRIGEKPIDFQINMADDIPYELVGDKTHIEEIINNLLTNAIKYTEQGNIELNVKCTNKGEQCLLMISVQDTGRGIKPELINKLFTKFERLDIEKNTTTEGIGLGLAITKALVDMMGGTINVQSQFGQGSIFMVQIPQKISKMEDPNTVVEIKEVKEEVVSQVSISTSVSLEYENKKILIVDDNKLDIKVVQQALANFNFVIDTCESGQACLDKINHGAEYDLILMDIMMLEMSGETTLLKLKENSSFHTPVFALISDADTVVGAKEQYMSVGFVDYIAKPFTQDQIKEKLDVIFKSSENKSEHDRWENVPKYVIVGNDDDIV